MTIDNLRKIDGLDEGPRPKFWEKINLLTDEAFMLKAPKAPFLRQKVDPTVHKCCSAVASPDFGQGTLAPSFCGTPGIDAEALGECGNSV